MGLGKIMNQNKKPDKKDQDKFYKYANSIMDAKLDGLAKALLWFYAFNFNWKEGKPSYWSQRRLIARVGMSASTYQKKRKYLEDLKWITVLNRGYNDSCMVRVHIGEDDPEYDNKCWAKYHPSNERKAEDAALAKFLEDSKNVFDINGTTQESVDSFAEIDGSSLEIDGAEMGSNLA